MNNFPSKRVLFAFVRIVSGQPYKCPTCARLGRYLRTEHNRQRLVGTRQFGGTSYVKSENSNRGHGASFLDFQLSSLRNSDEPTQEDDRNVTGLISSKEKILEDIQNIETGLDMSALGIEELEESLLTVDNPEKSNETLEHDLQPWYLRDDGGISEDEYAAIENLLDSTERAAENPESPEPEPEPAVDHPEQQSSELLPWYLREQESETSLLPKVDIHQTQLEKYPDLPYNSPPLLQPLVSRLFYDHHLQNIVLLDLRNRDPPPVWGSNTIMILATARSERQLTAIAEATAKWLKTTAGVQPRVDGLPKKESLIIKRRRLRRKSLKKPGYLIATPKPTTWVSMYTGYQGMVLQLFTEEGREEYDLEGLWGDSRVVDAGVLDMKPRKMRPGGIEEDERVVTSAPAKNQKKSMLQRQLEKEQNKYDKRKEDKAKKKRWTKEEKEKAKQRRAQAASLFGQAEFAPRRRSFEDRRRGGDRQHTRQLHTFTCRPRNWMPQLVRSMSMDVSAKKPTSDIRWKKGGDEAMPQKQAAWWGKSYDTHPRLSDTILPSSVFEQLFDALRSQSPFTPRDAALDSVAQTIALQGDRKVAEKLRNLSAANDSGSLLLLAHFGNLSRFIKEAKSVDNVRGAASKFSMDPFPEKGFKWAFDFFLRDMPVRPSAHHWWLAILYYLNLQMHDHRQYPIGRLRDILLLPVSQGISIPRSAFHVILNHIALSSPENRDNWRESQIENIFRRNVTDRLATLDSFLQCMKSQFGYDYTHDEEVYLAAYKACCQPYPTLTQLINDIDLPLPRHHNEERRILIQQYFQRNMLFSPEFFVLELLQFAHMQKWRSFLKRWNVTRNVGLGKDADMWSLFWCTLARGADQVTIRSALRHNFHEMLDEGFGTAVSKSMKSMAIGLLKCVEIVDPNRLEFTEQRDVAERLLNRFQ